MSFVNVTQASARAEDLSNCLIRMQSLTPEQASLVQTCLNAQNTVNNAISPSNLPVSADPNNASETLRLGLEGRSEVIRNNLTNSLGFTPTNSQTTELARLSSALGTAFGTTVGTLGSVITQVEGGLNAVLAGLEQGVTSAITSVVNEGQNIINSAAAEVANSISSSLPSTSSLIPEGARNILSDINDLTRSVNELTNSTVSTINSAIEGVTNELNVISTTVQNNVQGFIDSNITGPIRESYNNAINNTLSQPPVPPTPTTPTGEPYPSSGGYPQPGDNPNPIRRDDDLTDLVELTGRRRQELEIAAARATLENRARGI